MDAEAETEIDPYDLGMDLICNYLDLKGLGCDMNVVFVRVRDHESSRGPDSEVAEARNNYTIISRKILTVVSIEWQLIQLELQPPAGPGADNWRW